MVDKRTMLRKKEHKTNKDVIELTEMNKLLMRRVCHDIRVNKEKIDTEIK